MLDRVLGWVLAHRGAGLTALALLVGLSLLGVSRLRLDFSSAGYYGGDGEEIRQLRAFQARFGPDDDVLTVLVEAEQGEVVEPARLEVLGQLGRAMGELPEVAGVESVATLAVPAAWLERAPVVPLFLSADGRRAALAVRLRRSSDDLATVVPVVEGIEAELARFEGREGLRLQVAGVPALRAAFFRLALRDQQVFGSVTLLLIGVILGLALRRVHAVAAAAAAALLPTLLLLGAMGAAGEPIGLVNQTYFTLVPVLCVSGGVHLVARFHAEQRAHPADPAESAIRRATRKVGPAVCLASLTTAAGFLSLLLTEVPVLRSFGGFAALGLLAGCPVVLLVVPMLLSWSSAPPPLPPRVAGRVAELARGCARRPWRVVATCVVLASLAGVAASRVRVDNRLDALLSPDHPVREASAQLDASLGGTLSLELSLAGPPGSFARPEVLAAMRRVEAWASSQPGVRVVLGPAGVVEAAAELAREPTTSAEVEGLYRSAAPFVDLSRLLADDRAHARISIRLAEPGAHVFESFADAAAETAQRELSGLGVDSSVTGTAFVAYTGLNRITTDLRASFSLLFIVVSLTFLLLFRSLRAAAISVPPNLLPLWLGYGAIALSGRPLDSLAAVILILALGVAVDDTIHLLVRVREERAAGRTLDEAIEAAYRGSGTPVVLTSVVIAAGLAIDLFSSFPPLQMLGGLGAFVMLAALAADLVLLPALLGLARPR